MKEFKLYRKNYIENIKPFIDKNIVKVITGIRRSGKSVMMELIQEYLLQNGIEQNQILSLNFESLTDERIKSVDSILECIKKTSSCNKKIYLFFDEIQEFYGWEKIVNSLFIDFDCDIFITGSNAKLLSGELATYLAGRYVEFKMYPFSFSECYEALKIKNPQISVKDAFSYFLTNGGFPFIYQYSLDEKQTKQYLDDIFNSIILKDIAERNKIRDISLLKSLILFFIANVGNTFSSSSLVKFLKNEKRSVSTETIYNYIEYCKNACLLSLVSRQNLIGKEILSTQQKIFICDIGLRQYIYGNNSRDINQVLENIVFNELLKRNYEITIGKVKNLEVDFCATKNGIKEYYQVAYLLPTQETVDREFGVFDEINDNFPKFVLSLDEFDFSQNGIIHKNIKNWLLEE